MRNKRQLTQKSKGHQVIRNRKGNFTVTSGGSGRKYVVNTNRQGATCTCDWGKTRPRMDKRSGCTHAVAVISWLEAHRDRKVSLWANEQDAKKQRRPMANIGDGLVLTTRV